MLRHKRIAYRRIDLVTAVHKPLLRVFGFPGNTVPALRIDGARVQGTTDIALALDALTPSPPLFPADPDGGAPSRMAERLGRRGAPADRRAGCLERARSTTARRLASYLEGAADRAFPTALAARLAPPVALTARRVNRATDENARQRPRRAARPIWTVWTS